jgi:hypothetical protein
MFFCDDLFAIDSGPRSDHLRHPPSAIRHRLIGELMERLDVKSSTPK